MKLHPLFSVALICLACTCIGCDGDTATVDFETPNDAYNTLADAIKNENWIAAASAVNDDSQAMMASSLVMGASIMAGPDKAQNQDLEKLLKKHGIDMNEDPEPAADPQNYDPQAAMKALVQPVKNLPEFIGEISAWMKKTGKEMPGGMAEMGALGDVKIEGDTALAICQTDMGPQPIAFVKQGSGWLVDLTAEPSDQEMQQSGLAAEQQADDSPALGMIEYGDEQVALRHAMAYRSKFFDDPCIDVVLTAQPVYDRDLKRLKRSVKENGDAMGFFPRGPSVRLSIDSSGKVLDTFAWIDNVSMGLTPDTELDVEIEGDRIHGNVSLDPPHQIEERDREFQFAATFDVELMKID